MEERIIKLDTDVKNFKDLFFRSNQDSIFTNDLTKKIFRITLSLTLLTISLYVLGIKNPYLSWLFIVFLLFTFIALIFFIIAAVRFYSWKNEIETYLSRLESIKEGKLTLRNDLFQLQIDEKTIIERLSFIKKITIEPTHIFIVGNDEKYLFPSKSMKQEEFSFLETYFKEKVS